MVLTADKGGSNGHNGQAGLYKQILTPFKPTYLQGNPPGSH